MRAGSYGHTLGGAVALAMVDVADVDALRAASWEVDVAGRLVPAAVSLSPFYDPRSERVRV